MADTVKNRRWMPIILGLSLAINLAVVAAVGGAAWRHSGDARSGLPRASKSGALYMKALPRESRRAIREQMRSGPRPDRSTDQMLAALRSEPFDPEAAVRVLELQRDAGLQRQHAATAGWLAEVTAMNAQERAAYADRIEEMAKRGKERGKDRNRNDD
ncbi:periplasmic heavy metal sensor [uncultured Sulfitobacter sp.]|uniref:periplasmic heavy metal sensor n=1 Tax=uncultured Sulfitobacter sp. TaxID=191468 RepID=UPI00262E30F4|nr:periplasmic heavy metal sensor [uncultured Sulfitobacter sp.]